MSLKRLVYGLVAPVVVAPVLAATAIVAASPASAITCFDLPEYARAAGTLQGLSTCDMTVEEARRVIAAHDGTAYQPAPPARHRRYREPPQF